LRRLVVRVEKIYLALFGKEIKEMVLVEDGIKKITMNE